MVTVTKFWGSSLRTGILTYLVAESVVIVYYIVVLSPDALNEGNMIYPRIRTILIIVLGLITLFVHFLGIYGSAKRKPEFLTPYLVFLTILMGILVSVLIFGPIVAALFLIKLSYLLVIYQLDKATLIILVIGAEIICLCVLSSTFYIFIAVLSFQDQLKAQEADAEETSV